MISNSNSSLLITTENINIDVCTINTREINYNILNENKNFIDDNNTLAYILHTSGTTGNPKGVKISRKALLNFSLIQNKILNWSNNEIIIQKTPYIWDVSMRELISGFLSGCSIIITEIDMHKDPYYILNLIKTVKASFVHFVPSMLSIFLQILENSNDIKTITNVVCSGEALNDNLRVKFYSFFTNAILHNMYGPTEATVEVTNYKCDKNPNTLKMHIGKPLSNNILIILNKDKVILPYGLLGELYIGGVQVSDGYINLNELTEETFISSNYINNKIYKTGDLCRLLNDSNIEYLGRIDNQTKIRGMRIELDEINQNILKFNDIIDCYTTVYKENNKEYLISYISPENIDINLLTNHLSNFLPKQMIPDKYILLEKFPISSNGKLDKRQLPLPKINISNISNKNNDLTNYDLNILSIFSYFLNVPIENLNIDLDITYLGIDSIQVMSLQGIFRKNGYILSIKDFTKYKNIKELHNFLKENQVEKINIFDIDYYFNNLKDLVSNNDKLICIHSSLPDLHLNYADTELLMVNLLKYWLKLDITILIPSFTLNNFPKTNIFNKNINLNETGILEEIACKNFRFYRTNCPLYSFIVLGNNELFINIYPETSLGKNSVFDICEKYNAKLIGLGTNSFTQFHKYESDNNVPYRFYKKFKGIMIDKNNITTNCSQKHYVRIINDKINIINLSNDEIFKFFEEKLTINKICNIITYAINVIFIKNTLNNLLEKAPLILIKNKDDYTSFTLN